MFKSLLYVPAVPLPYKITFWKKLIKVLQSNSLHRMLRSVKSKGVKNLLPKFFLIAFSWLLLYYQRFLHQPMPLNHQLIVYFGIASLHAFSLK